jgi:hemoglobin
MCREVTFAVKHNSFMKADILSKEDVKLLVDKFYEKVNKHALLSPVFNKIANVNWEEHLPKMYAFWSGILLDTSEYRGQPFDKHAQHAEHITGDHFAEWLKLFKETIDEYFEGEKAKLAKTRADSIASIFQYKLDFMKMNQNVDSENN